jgi:hypothetical protein
MREMANEGTKERKEEIDINIDRKKKDKHIEGQRWTDG